MTVAFDILIKWIFDQYDDHLTEEQKAVILRQIMETERIVHDNEEQ